MIRFRKLRPVAALSAALLAAGCMRYLTHDREEVLLEGIDVDQTLQVARVTMQRENRWGSVLTVWAMRDQVVTAGQAAEVSALYFKHINNLTRTFNIWHLTWAIADMYRLGDEEVQAALQRAYDDAKVRARNTHRLADTHVNGAMLYMGDAHSGGRRYAQKHLVVPGNPGYLQSADEYLDKH